MCPMLSHFFYFSYIFVFILYYLRKYCNNTENYIILDDDKSLFINQDINLYLTNYKTGLIQEDINHIKQQIYHQEQKNEDNEREI